MAEPVPNRANDARRQAYISSVPMYTSPGKGASRSYSPGEDYDNAVNQWEAAKDSGATHAGKHTWYAVGGDEHGPEYDVCMEPNCPAERHLESKVDKDGYPTSYKRRVYPGGKK